MSKIRKFFLRKKEEAAFKLKLGGGMGQGRALNAPAPEPSSSSQKKRAANAYQPPTHKELSAEARAAAAAALARIEGKESKDFNTSLAAVKAQAKRELEAERKLKEQLSSEALATAPAASSTENKNLACQGVYFRCPLISDEVLPKKEWRVRIKEFLYQQLEFDRALTSCLIICNCNTKEKADECIQTLTKYLENIINHPDEEKYRKIRMSNRIFSEKVRYIEGALDFLQAAGFTEVQIDDEPFLIWSQDNMEKDVDLPGLIEALNNSEVISLTLDRNIKVLLPSQARRVALPDDFYRISPEEIKREQKLRAEAIEQAQILKTKAMREREEQRNLRIYRYSLVRVKFPNGLYIQGTFNVYDKMGDVYEFVQSCLSDESMEFSLTLMGEGRLSTEDMDKTLYDLRFIPNLSLLFMPVKNIAESSQTSVSDTNYLKEELLMLVQTMDV